MNDEQLLKDAARAAGIRLAAWPFKHGGPPGSAFIDGGGFFDPLNDDGEAFRLAVELDMDVDMTHPTTVFAGHENGLCAEPRGADAYAAARRAIVRAAASIAAIRTQPLETA